MTTRSIRDYLSTEERSLPLEATMDPGFVHRRKIQTILGQTGMGVIDDLISKLPKLSPWEEHLRIDHIYTDVFLKFCEIHKIKSLREAIHDQSGHLICSTEQLAPCKSIFDVERARSEWVAPEPFEFQACFEYTTSRVTSDTLKSRLHLGAKISIVAEYREIDGTMLVFEPILMGFPWVRTTDPKWKEKVMWWSADFFEHFVEDFDEFSKVRAIEKPKAFSPMKDVSERAFKESLCSLLGEPIPNDWGGETSDLFSSHIHLNGKRLSAAFLLKGPAKFRPMGLNQLGKNNDQIVRLSHEPAEILVVQHCHQILPPVRETLRAFAVRPSGARRYCLIDGRDSLWLLNAYNLFDAAVKNR